MPGGAVRYDREVDRVGDKYHLAYEVAPIAMLVTTEDGALIDGNATFFAWSGYERGEMIGKPVTALYVDPAVRAELVQRFRSDGRIGPVEVQFRRKSGEVAIGRIYTEALHAPSGAVLLFTAVEDVTAFVELRDRLSAKLTEYRQLFEQSRDAILVTSIDGAIIDANPAARTIFDAVDGRAMPANAADLYVDPAARAALLRELDRVGFATATDVVFRTATGRTFMGEVTAVLRHDVDGNVLGVQGTIRDITERRRVEAQLRQSQTFEALGRLAGGVAHDFNNLLTVVMAEAATIREEAPPGSPAETSAREITEAARRGAALTKQLLAVSRQQVLRPAVVDVAEIVHESERMLRRLIAENVTVEIDLAPDLWLVRADPSQLHQILLNLAINARDAMPRGGTLTIAACNRQVDVPRWCVDGLVDPGDYVELTVADTGTGMDETTVASVFEPFFTTKVGTGTGLGLSTVLGIVKQSRGGIEIHSRPGVGTTFVVFLPRAAEGAVTPSNDVRVPHEAVARTVLLVEDEPAVRDVTRRLLETAGYRVIEAPDGDAALRLAESADPPIDVLVTDTVMPHVGGPLLATTLRAKQPKLGVVFVSGYPDAATLSRARPERSEFVEKPFSREVLLSAIRRAVTRAAAG